MSPHTWAQMCTGRNRKLMDCRFNILKATSCQSKDNTVVELKNCVSAILFSVKWRLVSYYFLRDYFVCFKTTTQLLTEIFQFTYKNGSGEIGV